MKLTQAVLEDLYIKKKYSCSAIALKYKCSQHKVNYWLSKFKISKRTISEAIYVKHNPNGDPFVVSDPVTMEDAFLFGLGLGLYWGEGNKKNLTSVRLGNTNPELINKFIEFLVLIYHIDKNKLRFGLQIFSDTNPNNALRFWRKKLGIPTHQFYKTVVTKSGKIGTYRTKSEFGVLTLYYNNKKLRNILCSEVEKM